jgi:6-pyruvoyltetrahydropterin/6-carboxytetrahydropterin synthase
MWIISKSFTFEAAHKLPLHDGKCQKLHGHSWKGTLFISSETLIKDGVKTDMVMDYGDIKKSFKKILDEQLDHCYLNESLNLENPTSEKIAEWLYNQLITNIPNLIGVKINETCTSSCFYSGNTKPNVSVLNSILG